MYKVITVISDFVFIYPLSMSIVWILGGWLFYWRRERGQQHVPPTLDHYERFSILVPAHNEVGQIEATVERLLALNYPDYEIIVADDGSTDGTTELLHRLCGQHERLRAVYMAHNGGKAAALNAACAVSRGDYILTIDADAQLEPDALRWMAYNFQQSPRVGAVTGNPRVLNRTTLLAKIQTVEFATIIGLIKRAQRAPLGKVMTVSGVIAAFRKQALVDVGMWDTHMATDDIDISWRLQRRFWEIRYEPHAIIWMLVPESLSELWHQRLRWSLGGVEVLKKNADIWKDWKQRRLYPVYLESATSIVWAYCLWLIVALRALQLGADFFLGVEFGRGSNPMWVGATLTLVCIVMFLTSLILDDAYERRMLRYFFWVIWYPIAYWLINASTVVIGFAKVMLRKKGAKGQGVWKSPDRGISDG